MGTCSAWEERVRHAAGLGKSCQLCCCFLLFMACAAKAGRTARWCAAQVAKLQRACLSDPVRIEVASKYKTVDTLRQEYLFIPAKHKVGHAPHRRPSTPGCRTGPAAWTPLVATLGPDLGEGTARCAFSLREHCSILRGWWLKTCAYCNRVRLLCW